MDKCVHLLLAVVLVMVSAGVTAAPDPRHVVVAVDLSSSTPLVTDESYAARAGNMIEGALRDLRSGDRVSFRTLGDYGAAANSLKLDWTISRRRPAAKVRRTISQIISQLPALVQAGRVTLSKQTDITGFLELMTYTVDCTGDSARFLLFTDGVEWSSRTNGRALSNGNATLPRPPKDALRGCSLSMIGIGQLASGSNPRTTNNLISAWQRWANAAGVEFNPRPEF